MTEQKKELKKLVDDLLNLDYKSNTFLNKKHEINVKSFLLSKNFRQIIKISSKGKKRDLQTLEWRSYNSLSYNESFKNEKWFIEQPFGSRQSPDFIICLNGLIVFLECKSSEKDKITWNSGFPRVNVLYIFTSQKYNYSTLFFGQSTEILEKNPNFEKEYDDLDKKYKEEMSNIFSNMFDTENFSFYMRRMLNDGTHYCDENQRNYFYKELSNILS